MPYGQGGTIEALHFNGFVSDVGNVWGTGSGTVGYGQSGTISTVAVGGTVQASSWASLISRINAIRQHQSGVASGFTSPATGNTIAWFNNMNTMVSSLVSNSLSFNAQGTYVAPNASMTLSNATGWTGTCTKELSIHWSSANAMRYFFNAGGEIRFGVENSLLTGNAKSADWDLLLNNMGRVRIRSNNASRVSGSGGTFTSVGFWNLGTTQTTVLSQTSGTAGYTANTGVLSLRLNAAAGSSNVMYVRFIGTDGATDVINDTVSGTVSFTVDFVPPSTTYLTTNSWGTLTFGNLVATNTQV